MSTNYLSGYFGGNVIPRQISDIIGATGGRDVTARMLKIGDAANMQGSNWGDAEFQRALAAGYSMEDVNSYLKWSGITPQGNFAVGGFNTQMSQGGAGPASRPLSSSQVPYYRYTGPATAPAPRPAAPATPAPAPAPAPRPLAPQPTDSLAVGASTPIPEPKFAPGGATSEVDGGMAQGFRRKKSSGRIAGLTTKGTSQFKITGQNSRSSGLNIGT